MYALCSVTCMCTVYASRPLGTEGDVWLFIARPVIVRHSREASGTFPKKTYCGARIIRHSRKTGNPSPILQQGLSRRKTLDHFRREYFLLVSAVPSSHGITR